MAAWPKHSPSTSDASTPRPNFSTASIKCARFGKQLQATSCRSLGERRESWMGCIPPTGVGGRWGARAHGTRQRSPAQGPLVLVHVPPRCWIRYAPPPPVAAQLCSRGLGRSHSPAQSVHSRKPNTTRSERAYGTEAKHTFRVLR